MIDLYWVHGVEIFIFISSALVLIQSDLISKYSSISDCLAMMNQISSFNYDIDEIIKLAEQLYLNTNL